MSLPLLHAGRTNPGLSAALDLRFALDKSLTAYRGPTPSFSRASTGSYFDAGGVLRYQGYNLCQYSEDFTNAFWTKSLTSVSSNVAIAPNGQQTADKIIESASAGFHSVSNATFNLAASSTASVYLKAGERGFASVEIVDNFRAVINLSDGTVVSNTLASSTITTENAGNGWWRVKYTTNSSNLGRVIIYPLPTSTFGSYTGDGTSGIFAWGVQVETGATANQYSQTTNSANSGPRFNHTYNGTSWVSRGLLVEEQRTNAFQWSEDFSNAFWTKLNASIATSSGTSPDGTNTANKITDDSTNGTHRIYRGNVGTAGQPCTTSFYLKAGTARYAIVLNSDNNDWRAYAVADLQTGTITQNGVMVAATGASYIGSSITNCGDGWYRVSVSGTNQSGDANYYGQVALSNSATPGTIPAYIGTGSYIYAVMAQMELNSSFPTSYIKTTSSTATRSADVCQITGGDFSGFWNGTEGSVAVEFDQLADATKMTNESYIYGFQNAADTEQFILRGQSNGVYYWRSVNSGNIEATAQIASLGTATVKHAACYKLNDFASTFNGAAVVSDTSGATPNPTALGIGFYFPTSSNRINGHIARLRYYRKRLPNETLQLLSEPDPTLNLQFALNKSLTPVAGPAPSFSRASTGSYFDSTGTLKYANVNLLTYSEQFDNAAWSERVGNTLYTNVAASPIGDMTADQLQLTSSGFYYQKKAYSTTGTHTFSVWLRSSSPTTTLLRLSNDAGTENSVATCNVTTSWQRFSVTRNWSANPINFYAGLDQRTVVGGPGTSTDVFIWGAQLELASSPSQYAKTEASTTAGPRFDHVYSGGQWVSRGLLIEEQRTNGLLQSNNFGTSPWFVGASRGFLTQNAASPDGAINAWTATCTVTSVGGFYLNQLGISSPSGNYTFSMFAKKGNNGFAGVQAYDSVSGHYATVYFDLTNGLSGNVVSSGYTNISHGITNCGNGWYRCFLTFNKGNSNALDIYPILTADSMGAFAGTSGQTNLFYGMQLESGAFPTSYIPTTSSSVTRSADVCQITGTSFNWMWNQGEGSVVAEFDRSMAGSVTSDSMIYIAAGTGAPSNIQNGAYITSGNITTYGYDSAFTYNFNHGSQLANTVYKVATAIKLNDFASSLNGLAVLTDNSGTVGTNERLLIGHLDWSGGNRLNGHIAKLIYYPARLTNTKLQQLST